MDLISTAYRRCSDFQYGQSAAHPSLVVCRLTILCVCSSVGCSRKSGVQVAKFVFVNGFDLDCISQMFRLPVRAVGSTPEPRGLPTDHTVRLLLCRMRSKVRCTGREIRLCKWI